MKDLPALFSATPDGAWTPGSYVRGPFDGVQGGAVAALMAEAVQGVAPGFLASVTTHFLKPVPLATLRVRAEPLRLGRRVSVIDAVLSGPAGTVAVQRATLITEQPAPSLPTPPVRRSQPERLPRGARAAPHGGRWLMDAMDARSEPGGRVWFRQEIPLYAGASPLSRVLMAADWAHGVVPPLGADVRPAAAIPNPDVTVHLIRAPRGDWVGLDPQTAWSPTAIGAGWASLHDTQGLIGRVAMSVAITLIEEPVA